MATTNKQGWEEQESGGGARGLGALGPSQQGR